MNQETQVSARLTTTGETPQVSTSGDFFASAFTVTFGIGQSVAYVTFNARPDSLNEPDEPMTVRLSQRSGYENVIFTDNTATGLIRNDDGPAPPLVTAPSISVVETDGNQTATLRVELSHTTTAIVTMNYSIYAYTGSQLQTTDGTDFTALTGSISIAPGSSFAEIPVSIIGDNVSENFEIIDVRLSGLVNGYFGRSLGEWDTSVVVVDDDGAQTWANFDPTETANYVDLGKITEYSSQRVSYWLDETTPFQTFSFEVIDPIVVQSIPFNSPYFLYSESGILLESNASRVDGIEVTDIVNSIAEGAALQSGQYFLVVHKPTLIAGGDFAFELNGVPAQTKLPMLTFDPGSINGLPESVGLEGSSVVFGARVSFATTAPITFDVEFRSLTALANADFESATRTLTIPAGETMASAGFISLFEDLTFEGAESFEVIIKNVVGAVLSNGQSEIASTMTILDNDSSPVPVFVVKDLVGTRAEGSTNPGLFTFEISRPFGGEAAAANVDWRVVGSGSNPASATDFVGSMLPNGTVNFAAGEITKTITIQVSPDQQAERDESFSIVLSNPSAGFETFGSSNRGMILNDDGTYVPGYLTNGVAESADSYNMAADEMTFYMSGAASNDVFGNELNNRIAGNNAGNWLSGFAGSDAISGEGGNDTLDGGTDADLMIGGAGDDLFLVDNVGDQVIESENEGLDKVISTVSFDLAPSIEVLQLTGSGDSNGTGNDESNTLIGNSGSNVLSGLDGDDFLSGGFGNDILVGGIHSVGGWNTLDGGGDSDAVDYSAETGKVYADLSLVQGVGYIDNGFGFVFNDALIGIENLFGGSHNDLLTGNDSANVVDGHLGDDHINGLGGDDILSGGAGNDTLVGGSHSVGGWNTLDGGGNSDTVDYSGETGKVYARPEPCSGRGLYR